MTSQKATKLSERLPEAQASTKLNERARKRLAIGLTARRPTAKVDLERPPVETVPPFWYWWPVFLLVAVIGASMLLLMAKVLNSPTDWPAIQQDFITWFSAQNSPSTVNRPTYRLQIADNFNENRQLLASQQQPDQWWMNVLPTDGVYRMDVWPNHLAWSTLGVQPPTTFRLELALALAPDTPTGYGGLLGRYQDPDNFYFFAVDGQGQFQAQLRKAGIAYALQPWTPLRVLHPAGQNNVLALDDDNVVMSVYLNNTLVFEVLQPQLPPGQAGVIGGATDRSLAKLDVDWLKVYSLQK